MSAETSPRYQVSTFGRNHYVTDTRTGEFAPAAAFTSKRKAQERADEKNAPKLQSA